MLLPILSTLEQEFLSFIYGGSMRQQRRNAWAAGWPLQANDHQKNRPFDSARIATSQELLGYAQAIGEPIPTLPVVLRKSVASLTLSVNLVALAMSWGARCR